MKPFVLFCAIAGAFAVVTGSHAQTARQDPASPAAAPVRVTVPAGSVTFDFNEIDRNGDRSISVEEWNAFVASLSARMSSGKEAGSATGGATTSGGSATAPRPPQR